MTARAPKLLVCTTVPITPWAIMRGQLRYLSTVGFDVLLVSSPGDLLEATGRREGVRTVAVAVEREIRPWQDLCALAAMVRLYRNERPDISLVSTPKAGLLAGIAAWITRVEFRVYLLRGLRLETAAGPRRWLLWLLERVSLHAAHEVIAVSPSLLVRTRELRLLGRTRGVVLGRGASNGIDPDRFAPTAERRAAAREMRLGLGIPDEAFVFGFVGRLAVDKGIGELAEAFSRLAEADPGVWLLVVGPREGEKLPGNVRDRLESIERVRYTGWVPEPDVAYQAIDALVLPTYREGFPNVCIEAAAAGKPVITTTATGAIDSIVDGSTGHLIPSRDPERLFAAMRDFTDDRHAAAALGVEGRQFAAENFANLQVWSRLARFLHTRQPSLALHE